MKKYLEKQKKVLEGIVFNWKRSLTASFLLFKKNIPKEIVIWSIVGVVALNFIFYDYALGKEFAGYLSDKPVFNNISNLIYKISWEKNFKMEELSQEADLSKIKEGRANKVAQEETTKRDEAEVAKREAEVAKDEAEEKTRQEAIKRSRAEVKAKQEEFERKLKEQELSENEAEEERMNADIDGDSLTYREELKLGTSDLNSDSDGDGIVDNKDTHPAGGGRNMPQTFTWNYGGYDWNWIESIQEDWYDYYKAKPRSSPESLEYITSDDPFIKKISEKISKGANDKSNISEVWLAVSFVQNLPYVKDIFTGYDEYPKYPIETFFEKNGDCEDTSYLTASIIDAMGYGSVLILLPGHMAVGVYMNCDVSGTYYEVDGRCYYYIETTNKDFVGGEIPDSYRNTRATIIRIPSGKTIDVYPQYEKPCEYSSDFSAYSDGVNFYTDSQCNNQIYCLSFQQYYVKPPGTDFYWDSSCSQLMVRGCSKSTSPSGYFISGGEYYYDSQCSQTAKVCRFSTYYSDRYWDGYDNYWDSSCTQKVVSWCVKATYYPGYFFSGLDYEYYYDNQCTQKVTVY
ncbi:hypothetical protein KKF19_03525 [Patescibacteria group bacterium]|nr:hypothetical protein [Patescibacteria group bacterium]